MSVAGRGRAGGPARRASIAAAATIAAVLSLLAACGDGGPVEPPSLADATFVFAGFDSISVDLAEGRGEVRVGEVVVARAGLTDWVVEGDPDGDGVPGAIAVAWVSGGGSGTFFEVALMDLRPNADGVPVWTWLGSAPLGDRIRVRAMALDGATVELHLTEHGVEDAMCCPTSRTVRRFRVTGDGFELVDEDAERAVARGE